MLYSDQISDIIKHDPRTQKQFLGVYASNDLPDLYANTFIILNTEPRHKSGSHWVVLYKNKEHVFEFFDSLGKSPHKYAFKNFPKYKYIVHNLNLIQNPLQNTCGYFCLYFSFFKSRRYSINDIVVI